jgi:hypothetical protein
MGVDAALHSIGLSWERRLSLDQTLSKKLKQPFVVSKVTWELQNHVKRHMQTRGFDLWSSKLEIMCIWEFHAWKAWSGLGWKENWRFATSDRSLYSRSVELWPTSLTYHHHWLEFMTSSTCRNSSSGSPHATCVPGCVGMDLGIFFVGTRS